MLRDPIITDWRYFDQDKAETKLTSPAAAPAGLETDRHSTGHHQLYNEAETLIAHRIPVYCIMYILTLAGGDRRKISFFPGFLGRMRNLG